MTDRATILQRIRAGLTQGKQDWRQPQELQPTHELLSPISDRVGRFRSRAEALSSTVIGPVALNAISETVARYLSEHRLPPAAVAWPDVARLDWTAHGIAVRPPPARPDDAVGITGAYCAIAETGTLALLSGTDTPATVSLLPETHVALVPVTRIVAHMEDCFARLRAEHGTVPRAINFVSGPSRTADIEQTVSIGAHGPYRVLIVLCEDVLPS